MSRMRSRSRPRSRSHIRVSQMGAGASSAGLCRPSMDAWRCLTGPRLRSSNLGRPEPAYVPPKYELWGDNLCVGAEATSWALLTSMPVLFLLVLRLLAQLRWRDEEAAASAFAIVHSSALTRLVYFLGFLRLAAQLLRGFGRMGSAEYRRWHTTYRDAAAGRGNADKLLAVSDFEPRPLDYSTSGSVSRTFLPPASCPLPPGWQGMALRIPGISNQIAKTLARRLIYPGSVYFLQRQMAPHLLQGRGGMLMHHHGQRYCVKSRAGDHIDCMLCDRRGRSTIGQRLFITSEGNASFYEMGNMMGALQSCRAQGGASVLGWNHPGFGASTGSPSPTSEAHAIDAILEFAQEKLGYALGEIILHGWSIGGYATSWAAMNHPGIRGVLLDAPFDDLAPLAERIVPAMLPPYFLPFSEVVLRRHYNLDVAQQLRNYAGPLVIVRRMQDEVISGGRPLDLSQNRTNDLLRKFLTSRYGTGAVDWGALPSKYPSADAWIDGWLGAPVSAADGTSVQKDALIKALGLKAPAEAVRRMEAHLVSVAKNHTAPMEDLNEAIAKLEAQHNAQRQRP